MSRIPLLALLGAATCAAGDALCVAASRGYHPRAFLALSALAWACCAPIWLAMLRTSGGSFAEPSAAWSVVGVVFSVGLAMVTSGQQTRAQWLGFGLIVLGAAVRAVGEP